MVNTNSSNQNQKKGVNIPECSKCLYIMISKTSTLPSNVIKMWTREPYAHTSLALDIELKEMYSFARKRLKNPFDCGFISEDITTGVFGRDVDTICRVGRLRVTKEQYDRVILELQKFKDEKDAYRYNYLGIFGMTMNKAVEREYNYFCSQFVYHVLSRAGISLFEKEPGLVRPEDFRVWDGLELIYEGKLVDYRKWLSDNVPVDEKTGCYIEKEDDEADDSTEAKMM